MMSCLADDCVRALLKNGFSFFIMRCRHGEPDPINSEVCRGKLILRLSLSGSPPKGIMIFSQKDNIVLRYSSSTVKLLSDYSRRLSKLRSLLVNFWIEEGPRSSPCYDYCPAYKEMLTCKDHLLFFRKLGIAYTEPFNFYIFLRKALHGTRKVHCKNRKCVKKLRNLLTLFLNEVEQSDMINLLKPYHNRPNNEVYQEIFRPHVIKKGALHCLMKKRSLIKEYEVDVYRIKIYESQDAERVYQVSLNLPYVVKFLFKILIDDISGAVLDQAMNFELLWEKICFFKEKFRELLRIRKIVDEDHVLAQKLASYSAYRILGVHKLMPFLLDRDVDEIYLDKPGMRVYVDHAEVGRCVSNVLLTNEDAKFFINHVMIESKLPLNYLNPSLKWNLRVDDYIVRTSIDIPPLSYDGPSLDLRKIKHRSYTVIDLIHNNVLSLEEAAFLVLHILNRRNIIICGEPGTGKTTLMNALDLCTPKNWRKIYVEDVVESIDQRAQGRHQLKLHVEPLETQRRARRKYVEMIKLLHRTPDWICMGELQSKEHFKAMFHAITAGLRGMHTCHASSVQGLVRRWLLHCDVHKEDVMGIDLLVHTIKCYRGPKVLRRVAEVWTVDSSRQGSVDILDVPLTLVFKWNSQRDLHETVVDNVFETPSIRRMVEAGNSYDTLKREYESFKTFLISLMNKGDLSITTFTKAFDELVEQLIAGGVYVV